MPTTYIEHQKKNTLRAYVQSNKDYSESVLDDIVDSGLEAKSELFTLLRADHGLLIVERPLSDDELLNSSHRLNAIMQENPTHAFDFSHKQVTERATGKCLPLKKFLKNRYEHYVDEWVEEVLTEVSSTKTLLIAAHPWFLIGSSVAARGENVESSCHHPDSSTEDYKSGAIAYSQDSQTMIFGAWDTYRNGLTGRQLVWVDKNAPGIVVGRKYGYISETDSKFLRSQLYPLISTHKYNEWKKTGNHVFHRNGYAGYMDASYFEGYRPQRDNQIVIHLTKAVCPSCGNNNYDGTLLCDDCDRSRWTCEHCDGSIRHEDDVYYTHGSVYCESCYNDLFFSCQRCGESCDNDECVEIRGYYYCQDCASEKGYQPCADCGEWERDMTRHRDEYYCDNCTDSRWVACESCSEHDLPKHMQETTEGTYYCSECSDRLDICEHCGGYTYDGLTLTVHGTEVCDQCVKTEYKYECPVCHGASDVPHACCEECATENLFREADAYAYQAAA